MRRVTITKNIINKHTVIMGLSWSQIITVGIGTVVALGTLYLLAFQLGINIELVMSIVFVEIVVIVFSGLVKINGMNLFKLLFLSFKGPDIRKFNTKGLNEPDEE